MMAIAVGRAALIAGLGLVNRSGLDAPVDGDGLGVGSIDGFGVGRGVGLGVGLGVGFGASMVNVRHLTDTETTKKHRWCRPGWA